MKNLKLAGVVLGTMAAVSALAVALALTSGVQTWAVRKAVAGQPGMTIEVAKVDAGVSAAQITGLRVVQDGRVVTATSVSTRHSVWAYLTGRRIDVDELVVKDLVVDLRPASPPTPSKTTGAVPVVSQPAANPGKPAARSAAVTKADSPPAVFEGLLKQARLPFAVRVGRIAAAGRALLPDQQQVVFDLQGTNIETGQRGRLEWTSDYSDATTGAPIRAVRSTGTVQLSVTRDRRIDSVEIEVISSALGPNIPTDQVKLVAKAVQPAANGDEDYSTGFSLVRGGKSEAILTTHARFAAAQKEISGTWEIALRSEQLAALLAGFGLPEIAASGAGKFNFKPTVGSASASGALRASASQLQKLSPALAAVGSVQLKSAFDGSFADSAVNLNSFEIEITDGSDRRFAQVNLLQQLSYRLVDRHVTLANAKAEAARVTLDALPLAWAQPVVKPLAIESGDLSLSLAIEAEPDGSRVRARALTPLALRHVTVRDAQKKALVENLTLTTRPSIDYTVTKLSAQLADLKLAMTTGDELAGTISADLTNLATKPATSFRVQLQAKVVTLLKPFVAFDPGALTVKLDAEGRHEGDSVQLAQAGAIVNRDNGALLAAVDLQQPVRMDLKASSFAATNPAATAARLRLGEIPLAWAEPYVAKAKFAGTLAGATVEIAMRSTDDLTVSTLEPVSLRGLTLALDAQPMLQAVDLTTSLTATKRKDTIAFDVRSVEVKQDATVLASLRVAGEAKLNTKTTHATVKGTLVIDAPALLKQPALAQYAALTRGSISTTFEATVGDATDAKAVISAKNLVAQQDNRALGDLDLTLTATLKGDGSGSVNLPLAVMNGGRKSDLLLVGSFGHAPDKETLLFNGRISSTNLVVDDLQALAGLAPAGERAKPTPPTTVVRRPNPTTTAGTAKPTRDAAPFWQGVNGRADVDLKRVLYGKDYTVRSILGAATLTNSRLALENLSGSFRDNAFKLAAAVTFAPVQPQPYALTGLIDVTGIAVGELLRAASPKEKPMLESTVKVAAQLSGNGRTLPDLLERTYGTFDISGGKGVLRALGQKGETVSAASTLLGLAGAISGSANTASLGRLGHELEEMQFDSFALRVERDAALNLKFTAIEFLSPTKRLSGTGAMQYVEGSSFENWPFQFDFKLAGKDFMAQLLNEARVLSGAQDDKGYYPMATSFPVSGTASKVSNGLWKILAGTAARAGLESFLRR